MSIDIQEHERQLLGKLLLDPKQIPNCELPAAAFSTSENRLLFVALADAYYNQGGGNIVTGLVRSLGDRLSDCGGIPYLTRLMEAAQPAIAISLDVERLTDDYQRRQAHEVITAMVDDLGRGADPRKVLERATETQAEDSGSAARFPLITAAELAASSYDIEYLIPGVIVKGQPHAWGGPAKCLKTSTALDCAISLATGGHFLGYFPAKQVNQVVFLSGESGMATIKETAARICDAAGVRLEQLDRLTFCQELPQLHSDDDIRDLRRILERVGADVVFIDPLYLMMAGVADKAGVMFATGPLFRRLAKMAEQIGVTLVLLHHSNRQAGKEFEPLELHDLAWSGIVEFARAWVLVSNRERYDDATGLHRLWLVAGGSAGHSGTFALTVEQGTRQDIGGRVWRTQVLKRSEANQDQQARAEEAKERKAAYEAERALDKLMQAAKRYHSGGVKRELKDASGLKPAPFDSALALALERELLIACDVTRGNRQTYQGYRINPKPSLWTTADHCGLANGPQSQTHTADPPYVIGRSSVSCVTPNENSESLRTVHSGTADDPIPFGESA